MPKSYVPIRICGSKTRAGCKPCKRRHVKCDERRPICLRCQKADRECVYDPSQPQIRAISEELHSTNPVQPRGATDPWSTYASPSPYGQRELAELTAVRTFTTHLGKDLAGCFSDDVWCQVFPRVAQHEPSIWHGVVAVSMLSTSIKFGRDLDPGNPDVAEAIRQYSKAIQKLNSQLTSGGNACHKDVVLLCCILFAIFECLQSHFQSALRHITGGVKLLMEWEKEAPRDGQTSSSSYFDQKALKSILLCLDSQAVQMGVVDFQDFNTLPAIKEEQLILTPFGTVHEAYVSLNSIFNRLTRWTGQIEAGTSCGDKPEDHWLNMEKRRLEIQFLEWDWAFEASREHFDSRSATLLLSIQKIIMQTIFDKEVDGPSEMEWDEYLPRFEEAVTLAEVFISLEAASSVSSAEPSPQISGSRRSVLTVTMEIVLPLYLISTRCRSLQLRRKALKMLETCGRREGIWDSRAISGIAQKIVDIEEDGASEDGIIPECARVWQLECSYGKSETAAIKHLKLLPNGDDSYRIEKFS